MGREARSKRIRAIHLKPEQFERLMRLAETKRRVELEAQQQVADAVAAALKKYQAYLGELGREHGFPAGVDTVFQFDEQARTITLLSAREVQALMRGGPRANRPSGGR